MRRYLARTIEFVKWAKVRGARFDSIKELDEWLADYLEDAFYGRDKGLDFGANTFFGFLAIFLNIK